MDLILSEPQPLELKKLPEGGVREIDHDTAFADAVGAIEERDPAGLIRARGAQHRRCDWRCAKP